MPQTYIVAGPDTDTGSARPLLASNSLNGRPRPGRTARAGAGQVSIAVKGREPRG
jgi:hypothetical protein